MIMAARKILASGGLYRCDICYVHNSTFLTSILCYSEQKFPELFMILYYNDGCFLM